MSVCWTPPSLLVNSRLVQHHRPHQQQQQLQQQHQQEGQQVRRGERRLGRRGSWEGWLTAGGGSPDQVFEVFGMFEIFAIIGKFWQLGKVADSSPAKFGMFEIFSEEGELE